MLQRQSISQMLKTDLQQLIDSDVLRLGRSEGGRRRRKHSSLERWVGSDSHLQSTWFNIPRLMLIFTVHCLVEI